MNVIVTEYVDGINLERSLNMPSLNAANNFFQRSYAINRLTGFTRLNLCCNS